MSPRRRQKVTAPHESSASSGAFNPPGVPLADPLPVIIGLPDDMADEQLDLIVPQPIQPIPAPIVAPKLCIINLKAGCYRIIFRPKTGAQFFQGTLRVDKSSGSTTISGDLYRFFNIVITPPIVTPIPIRPFNIPIYARNQYYSYLKVNAIQQSPVITSGPCQLKLTAQEYVYTQPPAGSFNGTFPNAPGTRTIQMVLEPKAAPAGFTSSYFEGKLFEGVTEKGTISLGWVSDSFRRATLEIDTLKNAVAPQPVPALSGGGIEDFKSVFTSVGWDLNVVYDQVSLDPPVGVNPNDCWPNAKLHELMLSVRKLTTNLDKEWHMHLVVIPAKMGCSRGIMYDQIGVPREGVASFSDDGYPTSDSANFGAAANKKQRDTPRAFLRSASHEVGHGFNQVHQEQELGSDNSIMTTTPNVANVLGGPASGLPGVFPNNINLGFNNTCRHHLIHFPDIAVRPGGMTFGSGHGAIAGTDRHFFGEGELQLSLTPAQTQIELGEPLPLRWSLTNTSASPIPAPSDIRIETHNTFISVTNPHGTAKLMPTFVIECEHVEMRLLQPGDTLEAETRLFWSTNGFAFESPGKHNIAARITWTYNGTPLGVEANTEVWVNFPQSTQDNDAAPVLLDPQVGMYVALGGANHLTDAVTRLQSLTGSGATLGDTENRPKALRGVDGILPS
ncbi:MAG: hypothetical protein SH847_15585 [Roseiflexaceae bacterium]|nr:hypothetical protein [Roseiflexaceae bacterium]